MNESIFDKLDFGPLQPLLDDDDITDISFCNKGQIWVRSLTQGSKRIEVAGVTPEFMERLAFQCPHVMGTTFNNAKPFLDAESAELRFNFVHESIATNGIACVIRKTPAKIRLKKEKLLQEDYFTADIHDLLMKCVEGHCNIIVSGETGSGKTEFVKYLASHIKETEKIITIEDTLELHLDKIFPTRDIVAMKTNNVASYTDVLVTCMRQNPKWILLSEVRSAEAVTAVRNSISSGHNILSTIHADKASAIPYRLYSLLETDIDVDQFLTTIYRYVQIGVHIKAYYSKKYGKFHREVDEVVEFYVDDDNKPVCHTLYRKLYDMEPIMSRPSKHLIEYLENQNLNIDDILSHLPERDVEEVIEENEKKIHADLEEKPAPVNKSSVNAIDAALNTDLTNQVEKPTSVVSVDASGNISSTTKQEEAPLSPNVEVSNTNNVSSSNTSSIPAPGAIGVDVSSGNPVFPTSNNSTEIVNNSSPVSTTSVQNIPGSVPVSSSAAPAAASGE